MQRPSVANETRDEEEVAETDPIHPHSDADFSRGRGPVRPAALARRRGGYGGWRGSLGPCALAFPSGRLRLPCTRGWATRFRSHAQAPPWTSAKSTRNWLAIEPRLTPICSRDRKSTRLNSSHGSI